MMATTSGPAGQGRRRQAVTTPVSSRVVSKPIPKAQTEDPREFQLGQIRRRFSPKETRLSTSNSGEDAVVLSFSMAPSDPDFPFDMDKRSACQPTGRSNVGPHYNVRILAKLLFCCFRGLHNGHFDTELSEV